MQFCESTRSLIQVGAIVQNLHQLVTRCRKENWRSTLTLPWLLFKAPYKLYSNLGRTQSFCNAENFNLLFTPQNQAQMRNIVAEPVGAGTHRGEGVHQTSPLVTTQLRSPELRTRASCQAILHFTTPFTSTLVEATISFRVHG